MGKRGGKKGRSGRGGGQRAQRPDYDEVRRTNTLFESYYEALAVVDPTEFEVFWGALRRELPNSFRFTGSKGHAVPVLQRLKDHYIPEITSIEFGGEPVEPPSLIPWFPDQLAWQMTTPKNVVRRFAPFASFQKYLVSETSVGNISRQEAVSMIPPLLMDVRPGMTVLDLCAAPGSKAAQLIEMVHGGEETRLRKALAKKDSKQGHHAGSNGSIKVDVIEEGAEGSSDDYSDDGRSTGLLIANDADYKRAHMLIHQMKRLNSPNLIVTNHDATIFPSIKLPSEPVPQGVTPRGRYLKFDRILADVPCSGDGTCRKNLNVWKEWNPGNALGLFATQVRILVRALQMLKVGGRVVYSTCSMNPVENEAVIANAIDRCGGLSKVHVVDCDDALPKLKRRRGLSTWKVMDKQGKIWQSWSDVEDEKTRNGPEGLGRLAEAMFPPVGPAERIPFERCMRVYPHLQDTGAFFITVLEKKSEIRARPEAENKKIEAPSSIIALAEEIEAKPVDSSNPIEKLDTLDAIAPPQANGDDEGLSAAARQNKEIAPSVGITSQKRELDAQADAGMATKRIKIRDETDEPAPEGAEDRQVHWPPPPGALLDISRPSTLDTLSKAALPSPRNPQQQHKKSAQPFEEPFIYLAPDHEELQSIYSFYNLSPSFPRDRFMVRNASGNPVKTIYYTSTLARDILIENQGKGIKFVHCGIKMFVKQDVQKVGVCKWRIQTEGLPIVEGWVGEERVVWLWKKQTLRTLLLEMFPKVAGDGWKELGEIGERVRDVEMGCCVLRVDPSEGEDGFDERLVLPLWRSLHSLNLMLPKEDRKAMLLRLYNDDSPLLDHSKDRFSAAADKADVTMVDAPPEDNVAAAAATQEAVIDMDVERNGSGGGAGGDTIVPNGDVAFEDQEDEDEDDDDGGGVAIAGLAGDEVKVGVETGLGTGEETMGTSMGV